MTGTIPMLLDGYTDLPPGKLANVVTYLVWQGPATASRPPRAGITVRALEKPGTAAYRALYTQIGTDFLWCSRAVMAEAELTAILARPATTVLVLDVDGKAAGMVELDFSVPETGEIVTFGVLERARGTGAAGFLMDRALAACRTAGAGRIWLHTCNFDHPAALPFYRHKGFRPYKLAVEVFDDPRLTGLLPADAAPQIPLLRNPRD